MIVAAHRERYGRLDVLVNNAGVGSGAAVALEPGRGQRQRPSCTHVLRSCF